MISFSRYTLALVICVGFLFSCSENKKKNQQKNAYELKPGTWRGVLSLENPEARKRLGGFESELPFSFEVKSENGKTYLEIINAEERIRVDDVFVKNDSVLITMPVYDTEFKCRFISDSALSGVWINHTRAANNAIPFNAVFGDTKRFINHSPSVKSDFSGNWKAVFEAGKPTEYAARGEFRQNESVITGTFLTETGDYRYLEGSAELGMLRLSCFDGSNAFLFCAKDSGGNIVNGVFLSGIHSVETWTAEKNDTFSLRAPDQLTFVKEKTQKIGFSLPDENGKIISLSDKKFQNKVVIIQIMGTWCPNCLDESGFLAGLHKKYNAKGLEIIAIDFERVNDPERTKKNVARLKSKIGIPYDVLISDKITREGAKAYFPMLNDVTAFPTTIYIDKNGNVKTVHTGFSGPGTGVHYEKLSKEITSLAEEMLKE